jgi:hypothetical protein
MKELYKEQIRKELQLNNNIGSSILAEKIGISRVYCVKLIKELGLQRDRKSGFMKYHTPFKSKNIINIHEKVHEFIIGSLLGDGHITLNHRLENSRKNNNSKLSIKHANTQKEYCLYKESLIKKYIKTYIIEGYKEDKRGWNVKPFIILETSQNISFNKYREEWYKENKIIPQSVYNEITPFSLAIWYQDDGSKHSSGGYYLFTNCFTIEENKFLCKILKERFNITAVIHNINKPSLYIKKESREDFKNLILPYIHESMLYKI